MKNKGYTLIEVIAVVVVLSVIILIAIPSVNKSLRSSKEKAYKVQIEEIKSATKAWGLLNPSNLPSNEGEENGVVVTLFQLKLSNLISSDFQNPKTGDLFPDDLQISIIKNGMNLVYNVIENSGTSNEIINPEAPQLVLNGSINQSVEINEEYIELSATANSKSGESLHVIISMKDKDENTVYSVNTSMLNKYTITYSATSNGLTSSISRVVNIVDTKSPVITVGSYTNNQYVEIESTSSYSLPVASITDNSKEISSYYVLGNFSSVIPGNKKVTYVAVDSSNNKAEFVLNFVIKDTIKPVISSASIANNPSTGKNTVTVVASDSGVGLHEYAYSYDNGVTWKKENVYVFEGTYNNTVLVRDKVGNQASYVLEKEEKVLYTLTINPDGGIYNGILSLSLESNQTLTIENPTRQNYVFAGWNINGNDSSINDKTFKMGSENTTLMAKWEDVVKEFAYTGSEKTYNVPSSGYYKLETWGAQGGQVFGGTNGGTVSMSPGYGGYSIGNIYLERGQALYINVGGQGKNNCLSSSNGVSLLCAGGYNGGGNGGSADVFGYSGGGGGATAIASTSGLLSSFLGKPEVLLIVSGGGGGSNYYNYGGSTYRGNGGSGGGIVGVNGNLNGSTSNISIAGTQSSGFSFGLGAQSSAGGGGGGGYYGGNAGGLTGTGAAGGSGYIGNTSLTNKYMYCYNCTTSNEENTKTYTTTNVSETPTANYAKIGNGYARITFISE